jgi:hypothetical protein
MFVHRRRTAGLTNASLTSTQEHERVAAEARLRILLPEDLLELAVGAHENSSEEELGFRMRKLLEYALCADGRRERVSRLMGEIEWDGATHDHR